jgi:hypothetical protein
MRYRLGPGERSSKYRPGQFVSKSYAKRYANKVRGVEPPRPQEPDYGPEPDYGEEWEVTAYYD